MAINNLNNQQQQSTTKKLNELQALFAPILAAFSSDQPIIQSTVSENAFQNEDNVPVLLHEPINNLLKIELNHIENKENPWFDNDICY